MLALWLCHLPVRKAYRSIYRLNDVTPEISLTVISSKEKKEKEGRKKSEETKNGKMLKLFTCQKLRIKNMGIHCPNIFFIFCIDTEL